MSKQLEIHIDIRKALEALADVVTKENIPDPGDGYRDFLGLTPQLRRILFVLNMVAAASHQKRHEEREDAFEDPRQGQPTPQGSGATPAKPAASLPSPPSAMNGAVKYTPKEFAKVPVPLEPAPRKPEKGQSESSTQRVAQEAATLAPVSPLAVPPPGASNWGAKPSLDAPRPAAAPAMPVRPAASQNVAVMPIETVKKTIFLKNARKDEAYEGHVEVDGLKGLRMEDAGGSSLNLDEATSSLKGVPTASGDFLIRLQGLLHGKRAEIVAHLAVIPDPKSLWVSKDSDQSDPFWKPNQASERAEGDLLCVAASKRGRSHAQAGAFRDDDFGLLATGPGGWHIGVVADGAGSAQYSRRASKVAVDTVLRELPKLLEEHVTPYLPKLIPAHLQGNPDAARQIQRQLYQSLAMAAFNAAKAIDEEAAVHGESVSAFSTTLIESVARKVPEGWFVAGFSVGDGGAAVFDVRDRWVKPLTLPDSGEFAGQTRFLQRSEFSGGFDAVARRIFFEVRKQFTAIALMTDGISDPKFPTESAFADAVKWAEFWQADLSMAVVFSRGNEEMERQLLDWLDFWSSGDHDDRTIVVLMPS